LPKQRRMCTLKLMAKTRVYRVEHEKTGEGPYNSGHYLQQMMNWEAERRGVARHHHPAPMNDGISMSKLSYEVFGFKSFEQYQDWFAGYEDWLHTNGYVLAVYETWTEGILYGERQLAFDREKSVKVSVESLAEGPRRCDMPKKPRKHEDIVAEYDRRRMLEAQARKRLIGQDLITSEGVRNQFEILTRKKDEPSQPTEPSTTLEQLSSDPTDSPTRPLWVSGKCSKGFPGISLSGLQSVRKPRIKDSGSSSVLRPKAKQPSL
jgi:hypothetical protein